MDIDYIAFSNLIIDDIVFPDGRSSMNVTGGSGVHALVGMRLAAGLSPLEAALRGVVSASFALKQLEFMEWEEVPNVA